MKPKKTVEKRQNSTLLNDAIADANLLKETAVKQAELAVTEMFRPNISRIAEKKMRAETDADLDTEMDDEEMPVDDEPMDDEGGEDIDLDSELDDEPMDDEGGEDDEFEDEFDEPEDGEDELEDDDYDIEGEPGEGGEELDQIPSEDEMGSDEDEYDIDDDELDEIIRGLDEDTFDDDDDFEDVDDDNWDMPDDEGGEDWDREPSDDELAGVPDNLGAHAGFDDDEDDALESYSIEELLGDDEEDSEEFDPEDSKKKELMDSLVAENKKLKKQLQILVKENTDQNKALKILKKSIAESNLLNDKLMYISKIFKNNELTEGQKKKVVSSFDRATNVREVKLLYSALTESFHAVKVTERKKAVGARKNLVNKITEKFAGANSKSTQSVKLNENVASSDNEDVINGFSPKRMKDIISYRSNRRV